LLLFRVGFEAGFILSSSPKQHIDDLGTISIFLEVNKGVKNIFILQSFFLWNLLPFDNVGDLDSFVIFLAPFLISFK